MKVVRELSREDVVPAYVSYDARKKGQLPPDTSTWDWKSADALDESLKESGCKYGIPAGYLTWNEVELTVDDLRDCAVVASISGELECAGRDLRTLDAKGLLTSWQPKGNPSWFDGAKAGKPFPPDEPFLLRRSVKSELPAKWYLEDGSGRATAVVANASTFASDSVVAYGFVGVQLDRASTFMKERFGELLARAAEPM